MLLVPEHGTAPSRGWANPFEPLRQQLTRLPRRSTMTGEDPAPQAGEGAIFEDSGWNYL
ncbi:hypothetical protein ABEV00_00110 [Paenibacillus thiaminolyticus]|uniref:hypothetical protein n=1 Tax=Paenibacillus thiaminolyticus TaxID=49283 RepID=UPI003D27FDC1